MASSRLDVTDGNQVQIDRQRQSNDLIRQVFSMYSEGQVALIRDALAAYRQSNFREDGRVYSWKDVHEAISYVTGQEINSDPKYGAENLRKFVHGETVRGSGLRKYPKPEWIPYVVDFLTHDDILIVTRDELEGTRDDLKSARFLIEYLTGEMSPSKYCDTKYMQFQREADEDRLLVFETINLERINEWEVFRAEYGREFYDPDCRERLNEWSEKERFENRYAYESYKGWAVITPEFKLLLGGFNDQVQKAQHDAA